MNRAASLRSRLALLFGGAVLLSILLFSAAVVFALYEGDQAQQRASPGPHTVDLTEDTEADIRQVLLAMVAVGPFVIGGAAALGYVLAGRALLPLKDASDRALAVADGDGLELELPVTGRGDEWDALASTLNGLLGSSRASMERIRHFTSDAAHELRTPLTTLVGEAELALRRERSEAELRQALTVILGEGQRLSRLVERLLMLARADSAALPQDAELVDLSGVLQRTAQRVGSGAQPSRIVTVASEAVAVRGDSTLLEQLATNLLDNALRHGQGQITATLSRSGSRARLEVHDEGPGIPPSLEPMLFGRFVRGDAARSGGGHGLGLSIARSLAELHGGTLEYVRPGGGGATFVVELPAA